MTNFTCPECDGELDDCDDGLICGFCHSFVSASQVREWIREENESWTYDSFELIDGINEESEVDTFRISHYEEAMYLGFC